MHLQQRLQLGQRVVRPAVAQRDHRQAKVRGLVAGPPFQQATVLALRVLEHAGTVERVREAAHLERIGLASPRLVRAVADLARESGLQQPEGRMADVELQQAGRIDEGAQRARAVEQWKQLQLLRGQ